MNEIKWQDAYRNQSFQAVYPEYYQLIQDTSYE
jgi:hypothetical protein